MFEETKHEPLMRAYFGELYGIAFFTRFVEYYSTADIGKMKVWEILNEVEVLTANRLRCELAALGKMLPENDEAMAAKGINDAEKWLHLAWPELMDTLVDWVAPYQQMYQRQTDEAAEHLSLYRLVSDHENAIYDFLLAEQRGDADSLEILERFLSKYGETL